MSDPDKPIHLDTQRRFYAEELRAVANFRSDALVHAFAKAPREHFLGPGPWQVLNPWYRIEPSIETTYYRNTTDADPKHLYHNVLVAIDAKRCLNNGEPAFLGFLIDALELQPGARVVHLGCGTGYYSAILAEVVGPRGHVRAIEIEPELAARARTNLTYLPHVEVIEGDGSELHAAADAILVNAGATHPRSAWLDSLRPGGRLLLPLTISNNSETPQSGQILKVMRRGNGLSAHFICQTVIFPCSGARDPEVNEKLNQAFQKGDSKSVQSLRRSTTNRNIPVGSTGRGFVSRSWR